MARPAWSLALHGGAGSRPRNPAPLEIEGVRDTLREALEAGAAVLEGGGRSLDAVQAAVRVMERSGRLNAGRGAVLDRDGRVEVDAAIMDGEDRRAGAVAAVRHVANPIDLARAVLEDGRHVLLVGEGAERFAEARGFELVGDAALASPQRLRELQGVQRAGGATSAADASPWHPLGTVGAVALDVCGRLAAATSTGGLVNKLPGRVGDSPLVGAGTLAESGVCAVSATGAGEYFIRFAAASEVRARMRYGRESVESAARAVIAELEAHGGRGGLIAMDSSGAIAMPFSTETMLRGSASATKPGEASVEL